jgi:cytochrome d ubiquinol oxidase subunit I
LQILAGDMQGLNTLEYQPAKISAIEARWETGRRVPLTLFALPDEVNGVNNYALELPWAGSLVLTHQLDGEVKGLRDFPAQDRPPVAIPFFAFRLMVGVGLLMLGIVAWSLWLRRNERLFDSPTFLALCQWSAPLGFIAVIAGWTVTEVGRQPWTIYGLMRTAESVSPSLTGADVLISLGAYMIVYLIIFPSGALLLKRIIDKGPADREDVDSPIESGRAEGPIAVTIGHAGGAP